MQRNNHRRRAYAGAGHGAGQAVTDPMQTASCPLDSGRGRGNPSLRPPSSSRGRGNPSLRPTSSGRGRGNLSSRPFRPSPLALYSSSKTSPALRNAAPAPRPRSHVQETIRQLEKVAQEVIAMRERERRLAKRPAPPPPSPPPECAMQVVTERRPPSPSRHSDISASDESSSNYSSHSSSPSSSPGLAGNPEPFHAPILKGEIPATWLARLSQRHLSATLLVDQPKITLTSPSEEELPQQVQPAPESEPKPKRNPRWAGLWDGEPDEIRWIEEYGQWSSPSDEQPQDQDELGAASDYDSDAHSIASSLFTTLPDTSSMSTSPPTSPTKARQSPLYYEHVSTSLSRIPQG